MNIALIAPSKDGYSETFIRAHKERLAGNIHFYYGGAIPYLKDKGDFITSNFMAVRAIQKAVQLALKKEEMHFYKKALTSEFKKKNIDLVLAEYGPTATGVLQSCKEAKVPLICYFHGYDVHHQPTVEKNRLAYKQVFEYGSAFFAVSKSMVKTLKELGAPSGKLIYNPCAANSDIFYPPKAEKNNSEVIFLAVGRFSNTKSPHLTILAFQKLLLKYPKAKLFLVGKGPLLEACQLLVGALRLEDSIIFKGVLPPKDIATLMHSSRAFVQHSNITPSGDSEGTPVAIMEAAQSALPVISTFHAGIPDIIIHEKTGYLVEEGDINGMANYMIKLAEDPALANKMGLASHKRISENFSMEIHMDKINKAIERIVNSN